MGWFLDISYSFRVGFQTKLKEQNMCHVNAVNENVSLESRLLAFSVRDVIVFLFHIWTLHSYKVVFLENIEY